MVLNEADITKSSVNVTVDVTTVDTGVAPRDGDLKSANFFDVAQFPQQPSSVPALRRTVTALLSPAISPCMA